MKKILYGLAFLLMVQGYTTLFCADVNAAFIEAFKNQLIQTLHELNTVEEKINFLNERIQYYNWAMSGNPIFAEYKRIAIDLKKKLLGKKRG